jgi:hypothetical protein
VKKKSGKRTTRGVKSLSAKAVAAKPGSSVKGGAFKVTGMSKTTDITLKRG